MGMLVVCFKQEKRDFRFVDLRSTMGTCLHGVPFPCASVNHRHALPCRTPVHGGAELRQIVIECQPFGMVQL